jgi:hypothetical protein
MQRFTFLLFASVLFFSCKDKQDDVIKSALPEKQVFVATTTSSTEEVNMNEYNKAFTEGATQRFVVSYRKPTVVTAKGGLKIHVNPAMLEKEDGTELDGNINVEVIELTNSKDLFKSNAATVSNGRLLVSGGSYYIGMSCSRSTLKIKSSKNIEVDLPALRQGEMELFYGERDSLNNMNWERAGAPLETVSFTTNAEDYYTPPADPIPFSMAIAGQFYQSLDEEVYLYNKKMKIKDVVDYINRKSARLYVDSICMWPKMASTVTKRDTNYLLQNYGPRLQYRVLTCKAWQEENDAAQKRRQQQNTAWETKSLAGKISKYYAPSSIDRLGWINCDRFYQKEQTDMDVEMPYALKQSQIEYFIIFKSVNGLLNGKIYIGDHKETLHNLPTGESVTLVAFTKKNGVTYQCKRDLVVEKGKKIDLDFKEISEEELKKMFGSNVRT